MDSARVGGIGICGSGSFIISAAKIDPRMKAIATVSMYDMGSANRNGLRHSQTVEQRKQFLAAAAAQRDVEFAGGEVKLIGGTTHELTAETDPIQREFYDFYRTPRGEVTETIARFRPMRATARSVPDEDCFLVLRNTRDGPLPPGMDPPSSSGWKGGPSSV